jgi:ATP-binding cassette, subfamily B, bacterial
MKLQTKQTLTIYWQHARRYLLSLVVIVIAIIAGNIAEAYQPLLYKQFFDVLAQGDPNAAPQLIDIIIRVFGVGFLIWAFWRIAIFTNNFFQPRVMSDLLNTCFEYVQQHSFSFFNNNFVGSLVTKTRRFSSAFEEIADQLTWNIGPVMLRLGIILVILYQRFPTLALIIFIWSLLYTGFNYAFARYKVKFDFQASEADSKSSGRLADTMTNNINIKLFGGFKQEFKQYKKITQEVFRLRKISWDLSGLSETVQAGLMVVLEFLVMYAAVRLWQRGALTIGDFALIQAYLIQIFGRLWDFGRYIRRIYERLADAEEMTRILTTPHEVQDASGAGELRVPAGRIEFVDASFHYNPKTPILKHFDLDIKPGERVAFIGPSGGGKSTIIKVLFRFLDIQKGKILIDGQDIAKVTQDSLHKYLALVPQDPILFHRSLFENIRYAKPHATREHVMKAAKLAHCHEFISSFPEGYDTFVGERGVKLSGGERQRVAIARAILKNAPILVLDEATSSLDSESELFIQDALKTLMQGKTTIVIAHRLSTIMSMDRIIVIENGKIIEQGKHEELVKAKEGTYQKLWEIQAGGFAN